MKTCNDCLHCNVCEKRTCSECQSSYCDECGIYSEYDGRASVENCTYFKDKSLVIVPPCKVGDTVYCIEHKTIHEGIVKLVKSLTYENETIFFVESECEIVNPFYSDGRKMKHGIMAVWEVEYGSWHRAFLTREAAEKALKGGVQE